MSSPYCCASLVRWTAVASLAISTTRPVHGFTTIHEVGSSRHSRLFSTCDSTDSTTTSRRDMLHTTQSAVLGGLCGWILEPQFARHRAFAAYVTDPSQPPKVPTADSIPSFVAGTVSIPANFDFELAQQKTQVVDPTGKTMTPIPALYVTVRPDRPDNVPQAILQGTRGKPPPVLSARFEAPTFPFSFHLTDKDYTPEGQPLTNDETKTSDNDPWWLRDDLIVSARLDMDGIAATRSPEDLVGRTTYRRSQGGEAVDLELMGRGAFGKFATQQTKQ
ncbi:expressed unknown protein [Seminavis robusta]|uniref:Uncharacterized protein n=1 Tax=Seminavis robusta TaxID=568900 RepID=A0A9N8H829_9STRA|nr:expressed unknown protein [Seminavis robusta]|eukprot:Sro202_g085460.1 n/a (276) ;mRNA; f:59668-60495